MDILQSIQNGFSTFFGYVPQLIGAIVILIVGYIVAKVVQGILTRVLRGLGFENVMERGGVKQFFDRASTNQTPTSILGKVAFWFVFIIFLTAAANALGIQQVTGFLNQLIAYIPSIFAAILILLLAALLANFIAGIIRGATGSGLLASVAQYAIIIYAVFAALTQLGIAVQLTANTFLVILAGAALAAAIAFGWGARNVAQDIVERAYDRSGENTRGSSSDASGDGEGDRPSARRLQP